MKNERIIGIAFPINQEIFKTISSKKEAIFFKFMPHQTLSDKLKDSKKLLFYLSKSGKYIVGECTIKKLELLNSKEILKKYLHKMLITPKSFNEYVGNRKDKYLLVFSINLIKIYQNPVKLNYPITMVGKYISDKEYTSWKIIH